MTLNKYLYFVLITKLRNIYIAVLVTSFHSVELNLNLLFGYLPYPRVLNVFDFVSVKTFTQILKKVARLHFLIGCVNRVSIKK